MEIYHHVNVVGHVTGNLGLGVLARNVVCSLKQRGINVSVMDVDPGADRKEYDRTYENLAVSHWSQLPEGLTLWVLPPETLGYMALKYPALYSRPGSINVAVPMWELPLLSHRHRTAIELFDIVIAQTDFIRHVIEFSASNVRSITDKHFLDFPSNVEPARARFRLPLSAVVYGYSFDPNSDVKRKNPSAVLAAFLESLGNKENAYLVVKVLARNLGQQADPVARELLEQAASHPRIRIINEPLSYAETLSLYASCDVYVSLHRAEGLGLSLMEAMALGKPVIATAWSGNMSFMSDANSCLVGYQLVPVQGAVGLYHRKVLGGHTVWAEPNAKEAAAWMRRLYESPEQRLAIGTRARASFKAYQAEAAQCHFLDTASRIIENWRLSGNDRLLISERERRLQLCRRAFHPPIEAALARPRRIYDRYIGWRFARKGTVR